MPENRPDTITEGIPTTATSKHYTATRMAVKGGSNAIHKHDNGIVIDQSVADPGWCYTGYLHVIFFSVKLDTTGFVLWKDRRLIKSIIK